ncbi:DNA polymerase III subunit delta [Fulvivirgaceae bacterium BMA12]|uniref:DNA polymerase III subunit delta n=1 Tax=Agaribacillus aureus TaxID=3051825 RepID=A0ABT8LBC0_9BACT|nr:DNA polymerase III subunit delta [Fulvivirgaceae bacterium BMA12]
MAQSFDQVLQSLKNGQYAPVYFLQGDEPYYIDVIANYLEENVIPEHERGFNQIIMYGKDATISGIVGNARRFPMMAERQLVLVKEAQEIQDFNKEEAAKLLEAYLRKPQPSTLLVFCYKYKTLDKRKALTKLMDKSAVMVSVKKLYDNQVPDWVNNYVVNKGHTITPKATFMITEFVGNNLERISNEIDKMLVNFDDKVQITEKEVEKYIGISKEYNVFELQKALTGKNVLKANQIINYFAANPKGNPVIPIIAMLFSFFSKLLIVHHTKDKSDRNLASVLKINPFFVKDYKLAVNHYHLSQVINNIHHLKNADLQSKGIKVGTVNEGQILKELVFKLLH